MADALASDVCRICLDDTSGEQLISPCAGCRGSSALVHFSCVAAFYRARSSDWWDLACPTCKRDYEGAHAVELGKIGLAELEAKYPQDSLETAAMLENLGCAYGGAGDAEKMRELLERALAINEREYGPQHCVVAGTLMNLGNAYGRLGDVCRKRDLLERALTIEEHTYGLDHEKVATTLTNLGSAYGDLGDPSRKRDLLERALVIVENEYGHGHRKVAVTLSNLGNAYGYLGDTVRLRDLLQRVLGIEEREYGTEHPEVALTLTNLAVANAASGEFELADVCLARAVRIAQSTLQRPSAVMADILLSAAPVRKACGSEEKEAADAWSEASVELRAAVGEATAAAKADAFVAHAVRFWTTSGRADVACWLASMAGL